MGRNDVEGALLKLGLFKSANPLRAGGLFVTSKFWDENLEPSFKAGFTAEAGKELCDCLVYPVNASSLFANEKMIRVGEEASATNGGGGGM